MPFHIQSPAEQTANYLREQILKRRWTSEFPGTPALADDLNIDRKTIIGALKLLEQEGLLQSQGPGKARQVILPKFLPNQRLKIRLMPYEESDYLDPVILGTVARLEEYGHSISLTPENLNDLKMDVGRISRYMEMNQADAWLFLSASLEVIQWLGQQKTPVMAIFGRRQNIDIASVGPDKTSALKAAIEQMIALGHQRIVYLLREERRLPTPGIPEQRYLDILKTHGITPGPYHMPDWQDNTDSFHECLDRLFALTPPSALIFDEAPFLFAAMQHLANRNLIAPRDYSMICCDDHPIFKWCQPQITHIRWDRMAVVRQVVYWANQIARGKIERKTIYTPAELIPGDTIGPAPSK